MWTDPTILGDVLIVIALLVPVILLLVIAHSTPRRSRTLGEYRKDVYRLQQAAGRERKDAAAACLQDVYRLTRKG